MLFGEGVVAQDASTVNLSAVAVTGSHLAGIEAEDPKTQLNADGILVEGTVPQVSDTNLGVGIEVFNQGSITVKGSAIRQNHAAGGVASDKGTSLTLTGTLIADMLSDVLTKQFGRGLNIQDDAALHMTGGAIVRARDDGIVLVGGATGEITGTL